MTQKEMILNHIKAYGSVTNLELVSQYGIIHPTSRITELRQKGHPIITEMKKVKNRFGNEIKVAVYSLEE